MKCLNCSVECGDNRFCDDLCHQGFKNRQYRLFNDGFKRSIE